MMSMKLGSMMMPTETHPCPHEDEFRSYSEKIAELEAHVNYKDKRIDELIKDQKKMEDKIDKIATDVNTIMLKSIQDDNNIDKRVTSLETTVKVIKWGIGLLFGSGLVWLIWNLR